MALSKQKIIEAINELPQDQFEDIDVVIEQIILLEKIELGLEAVKKGSVHTEEEVKKIVSQW